MYTLQTNDLLVSQLAQYLNSVFYGEDILITGVSLGEQTSVKTFTYLEEVIKGETLFEASLFITTQEIYSKIHKELSNKCFIITKTPRIDFYKVVNEFYMIRSINSIHSSAIIADSAKIGLNVSIGKNAIIGEECIIGNNTKILDNAIIGKGCIVGSDCIIKNGAIVGSESFEFINDGSSFIDVPQFGSVKIGNNVMIGTNTTIERPNFGCTLIGKNSKIDDGVNIGQGCVIQDNCVISSGVVLSKMVTVEDNSFIGINASVKEHIVVGANVLIGMGSVVTKNLLATGTYYGNPARLAKSNL